MATAEERIALLKEAEPEQKSVDELEVLSPDYQQFILGGQDEKYLKRIYKIYTPKFKQLKMIQRIVTHSKNLAEHILNDGDIEGFEKMMDQLLRYISDFIGEDDIEYLENTIGNAEVDRLRIIIGKVSNQGFPSNDSKKKA